jgi:hypothetical protein
MIFYYIVQHLDMIKMLEIKVEGVATMVVVATPTGEHVG